MDVAPDIRLVIASMDQGGSERVCLRLANAWAAQGLRVELLLVRRRGAYLPMLAPAVQVSSPDVSRTLRAFPWMRRALRRFPHVPALLFGFDIGVGLGMLRRLRLLRTPLIYREGSLPRMNVSAKALWRYRACIGGVDGIVAQSKVALDSLNELGLAHIPGAVIWNPVSHDSGAHSTRSPRGPFRCLCVGRISAEKGLRRLVEAFPRLLREHAGATLEVVGDGPQRADIEAEAARLGLNEAITFSGSLNSMAEVYARADFLIVPSYYEGQPNVLLEALLAGCRCVAAGGESVRELLRELGLADCLIADGDFTAELSAALDRASNVPPETWEQARKTLAISTTPELTSIAYYRFCREIASGVEPRPAV